MTGLGWKAASIAVWMPFGLMMLGQEDPFILLVFGAGGLSYALWAEASR